MAKRNPQLYAERRDQIIDGALQVFADRGFDQATNKEIAEAAGIGSAGLIYHYFKDKDDLLAAVVQSKMPLMELLTQSDQLMGLSPEEGLTRIARTYLRIMEHPEAIALIRTVLGEVAQRPEFARKLSEQTLDRIAPLIAAYLKRQMDLGLLRQTDPLIATMRFVGPMFGFVMLRSIFRNPLVASLEVETVITSMVDGYLNGMAVRK